MHYKILSYQNNNYYVSHFVMYYSARYWINKECCGLFCAVVTWGFVFFGQFATSISIIIPWLGYDVTGIINLVIFNTIAVLAVISHFRGKTFIFSCCSLLVFYIVLLISSSSLYPST